MSEAKNQALASSVITGDLIALLNDPAPERLRGLLLTPAKPVAPTAVLPFNSAAAFSYASEYCRVGNDCPDNTFDLDCTHFLCHCLNAGGVKVSKPAANCGSMLCIRVNDLAAALANTVGKYSNVTRITSHQATRRGDICFIPSWFPLSKEHAMLLAGPATPEGAMVYAHTNNRCGEMVKFEGAACAFYRIADAA